MKIKAKGQIRHRFWGEYSANIILGFKSQEDALSAQPILNKDIDFSKYLTVGWGMAKSEGWRHLKHGQGEVQKALFLEVSGPALKKVVERLVLFGAEKNKILSLGRSIDYGEPFEIEIEI